MSTSADDNSPRQYRLTTVPVSGHVGYRQVLSTGDVREKMRNVKIQVARNELLRVVNDARDSGI